MGYMEAIGVIDLNRSHPGSLSNKAMKNCNDVMHLKYLHSNRITFVMEMLCGYYIPITPLTGKKTVRYSLKQIGR